MTEVNIWLLVVSGAGSKSDKALWKREKLVRWFSHSDSFVTEKFVNSGASDYAESIWLGFNP